jgi:hypothetical protein
VRWGWRPAVPVLSTPAQGEPPPPPAALVITAGGLAGCAYWLAIYPIDTVKTAQQTAASGSGGPASFRATLRSIYASGGVRGLYAGLGPTLLRSAPSNAAVFLLYEESVQALRKAGLGEEGPEG